MKINNDDYTKKNIVDLLKSNNVSKSNFKTNFFDTLSKSVKKYEDSKPSSTQRTGDSKKEFKSASVLDLSVVSKTGVKAISELEKFLKSNPTEEDFNQIISSLKDILSDSECSLEDTDKTLDDTVLDSIVSLFVNYTPPNVQIEVIDVNEPISLGEVSLNDIDAIFTEHVSDSSQGHLEPYYNVSTFNDTLEPSGENSIEDIANIIDSTENEFAKIIESFGEKNISVDESEDILKKILELSSEKLNVDSENIDKITKKEDISINPNNLLTSSISLEENNIENIKTNIKSPIVHRVLESIHAQLSNESLINKTVELRLKIFPSKLGSVSVIIEKDNGSFNIKILSDNPEVRSLFIDSIQDLKFELSKNNFNDINIDISNGNQDNNGNNNKNRNENNTGYKVNGDYIEDITSKISTSNYILDKILDIKI